MEHLQNLKIVITAAASGLGSEIATTLSKSGSQVFICDNNESVLENFSKKNPLINCVFADVSNETQMKKFFSEIKNEFGEINVLINNAGVSGPSSKLEDIDLEDWKNTLDINLNGTFLSTKLAVPLLKNKGGSIINIGSTSSFLGTPLRSAYSASKWGLIGLTKTWAMEYGKNNIRVNTICPTFVVTPMTKKFLKNKKFRRDMLNNIPLGRFAEMSEISSAVVFLASDAASMITGTSLLVDGGWTAK